MASDEDYMNFLDKANQDPSQGVARHQGVGGERRGGGGMLELKTVDEGVTVPEPLAAVTRYAFYTSDADELFVVVALRWDEAGKGLPDEEELAQLIGYPEPAKAEVEIMDPLDWDSTGQYGDVIEAVRKAGKGNDVRVYRIARGGTRAEYWVLTTEGKGKSAKLVGVKALAVES